MIKVGIIGSDNSHAQVFSALANLEEGYHGARVEGVRVTYIYGEDLPQTHDLAQKCKIETVAESPEEMIGMVDAVICVWRHAGKHLDVIPFLTAGIPAFVDKPLALTTEDALRILDAASLGGVPVTSFSSLRYEDSLQQFIAALDEDVGELATGICTGPADISSPYGGIFFYGIHAVEIMNAVWGYGCSSVCSMLNRGNLIVTCKFAGGAVVALNFLAPGKAPYVFHVAAFGDKGWRQLLLPEETMYYVTAFRAIIDMFKTGRSPLSESQLLEPVQILEAIEQSIETRCEVEIGTARKRRAHRKNAIDAKSKA